MGRQGGILGCGSSCLWCQPCSEHCSTNLPASSCLPPGQQHPSGPAELLPVCFTSGLGRKSQTTPHVGEQVPCTGMSLLTSVIPVAGEDLNQKDFLVYLSAQGLLTISTQCIQITLSSNQCLAQESFQGISCMQPHLYFYIYAFLSRTQSCPGCSYVSQILSLCLSLALAGKRKSTPFSCSPRVLFWGQNCSSSELP